MIPRYSRPEMAAIWAPETRYRIWFEIEAHAADAMAELGIIPKSAAKASAQFPPICGAPSRPGPIAKATGCRLSVS